MKKKTFKLLKMSLRDVLNIVKGRSKAKKTIVKRPDDILDDGWRN